MLNPCNSGAIANRFDQHRPARRPRTERLLDIGILHLLDCVADVATHDRVQRDARIVLMLRQLAFELLLDEAAILGGDPTPLDEQVGDRFRFVGDPRSASGG
ncbi:MAG: hypothetical protein NT013_18845, partial [Planctomycetia bacterium]|nr:hypothetical protein [Planctomycetia bacterium]